MQIIVNGEMQEIPSECTVFELLKEKSVLLKAAVVEHNGRLLQQDQWQNTVVQLGDRLEILVFMGGG